MACVLVADDDAGTRETFEMALRHEQFEVLLAGSGAFALALLSARRPEIALLDLNLNDVNGVEVLRLATNAGLGTVFIAMTGFSALYGRDSVLGLGAAAYFEKPLCVDEMVTAVHSVLDAASAEPADQMRPIDRAAKRPQNGSFPRELEDFPHLLRELRARLRHGFSRASDDLIEDAAAEAILVHVTQPQRFDRSRGIPLIHFLHVIARRDLLNRLASEDSRHARERRYAGTLQFVVSGADPTLQLLRQHAIAAVRDPRERQALETWLDGDSTTAGLASALGIASLPLDEQRRAVKQFKDRMLDRLCRRFGGHTKN